MEVKERINNMLKDGKINAEQATQLFKALEESETRREQLVQKVLKTTASRQDTGHGMVRFGIIGLLIMIVLTIFTTARGPSRDHNKALATFAQSTPSLMQGDYAAAIEPYRQGVQQAPDFFIGHTLLALTKTLQRETISDPAVKAELQEQINTHWQTAQRLQPAAARMTGTGIFFLLIFLIFVVTATAVILLSLYNTLVGLEEAANEAFSQIAVMIQRRADLIALLTGTVENYARHEKDTIKNVARARQQLSAALDKAADQLGSEQPAMDSLTDALVRLQAGCRGLLALAENYPDLKAHSTFIVLQKQLEATENQIAAARVTYNQQARGYNAALRLFPANIMAQAYHFQPKTYFRPEPEER